ncbi:hypothetical protein AB1L30_19915 [Bremerella sp. JC817]|uniref:hypothetical protein n=1 Tax=Bremerella sp. JC817 TaxID=3231756 RepID=UPI00345996F2
MLLKTLVWSGVLSVALVSMTSTAQADHFVHRGRLVNDIEHLHHDVEDLYREVRHHKSFGPLAFEAKALLREVDHFCETAQRYGSLSHLKADFREVSDEMRHVQRELRTLWHRFHHHHGDDHILSAWADVERSFDRVYFDLYENHCGFIQYHCVIPVAPGHGHGHGHHGHGPGYYQPKQGVQFGVKNGKVQVHVGGNAPGWAHILKAAMK